MVNTYYATSKKSKTICNKNNCNKKRATYLHKAENPLSFLSKEFKYYCSFEAPFPVWLVP